MSWRTITTPICRASTAHARANTRSDRKHLTLTAGRGAGTCRPGAALPAPGRRRHGWPAPARPGHRPPTARRSRKSGPPPRPGCGPSPRARPASHRDLAQYAGRVVQGDVLGVRVHVPHDADALPAVQRLLRMGIDHAVVLGPATCQTRSPSGHVSAARSSLSRQPRTNSISEITPPPPPYPSPRRPAQAYRLFEVMRD